MITVKYLTVKDALGRLKTGWFVLDGSQLCGRYETEAEAERQAAALRQIRKASR